jgi:putative spermidine/putrescine transport system ATP-binding protein
MAAAVEFSNVSRTYASVRAIDKVSFQIEEGEFFSMLGPSGSGKTTCLRLIAGFEQPTSGSVRIYGNEAAGVPPNLRNVNTVFQDYALFPHMSVRDNVAYGLMVKGVEKTERYTKADDALAMVALADYGQRKPSQLSGGQRQRVALARALVNKPQILLLDEPLGALDLKLREQMQTELKALQRKLGITFIYVTHDQGEALSMSDRVAVFNNGRIEQIDTPRAIYMKPASMFVANFVGTSNIFSGEIALKLAGEPKSFSIRPEHISLAATPLGVDAIIANGIVHDVQYHGAFNRIEIALDQTNRLIVHIANAELGEIVLPGVGDSIRANWSRKAMVWLDKTA